jgi:hypothetical protein
LSKNGNSWWFTQGSGKEHDSHVSWGIRQIDPSSRIFRGWGFEELHNLSLLVVMQTAIGICLA